MSLPLLRRPHPALPAVVLAVAVALVGPACDEANSDPVYVELYPGEQTFQTLTVDAVGDDDELYNCNARIVDTIVTDLDLSLESIGMEGLAGCGAQLKVSVHDDARAARVRVRVEFSWTYYDAFFEEDREDYTYEDVHIQILSAR